jgi:hypothetical protein
MNLQPVLKKGTCEICEKENIVVYPLRNMVICADCRASEEAAIAENQQTIQSVVVESRRIDSTIELSQDIYNTATVSFVELSAAFAHDPAIPQDQKDYALVKEAQARIQKMSEAIFSKKAELTALENERHAWLVNTQNMIPKLRLELRAQFTGLDVTYKPTAPKTIKPKKDKVVRAVKIGFNPKLMNEMAAKYKVPAKSLQAMVVQRNIPYEQAARELAQMMGIE